VPLIFADDYGERAPIPAEFNFAPVIQKPYTRDTIERAIATLPGIGETPSAA
jgi:hypothetical protein